MRVLVTGAGGFIGRNLCVRLGEMGCDDVVAITRATTPEDLRAAAVSADFVFHLAGVNRPRDADEFVRGNVAFTESLCAALARSVRRAPVVYASSIQAALDNPYGRSKRAAEEVLLRHARAFNVPVQIFRLANVFGKWCRPNYNSVVATFCHQIARGLPITVHDPGAPLRLVHVDDVIEAFIGQFTSPGAGSYVEVTPVYQTTVGEVATVLGEFAASRRSLLIPRVGTGLVRALYATYVSYLPPSSFAYDLAPHSDRRGVFVEILRTPDCGQFSYFTALPGVTRGEHYHHSKTEKFLVVFGTARFRFRNIDTGEVHELTTMGDLPTVVESVPGWAHNITNIGTDELVVLSWANEIFDRSRPDTIAMKVSP
jgi:UDP-2-acetamido-2,6-beta-L-arabino-hexul-4-ose reductase